MATINKRRKLQHGETPTEKRGGPGPAPLSEDPRFQMNSDFSDSEEENDEAFGLEAAGFSKDKRRPCSTPGAVKATPVSGAARRSMQRGVPQGATQLYEAEAQGKDDRDNDSSEGDEQEDDAGAAANGGNGSGRSLQPDNDDGETDDGGKGGSEAGDEDDGGLQKRKQPKKVLSKRKLEQVKEASDRRGIVFISRIPPHMKPHKLRQLLEPFGDLGRVYCAPEDPALRRLRKKKGGNSGKNFTEGWVEFEDKRRAKRAALALNGQPIGGSKRSAYFYDLWNIKYLPKFKWDTLTEEINYQRAVREQRLVAEISAAKRERDFYLSRVDKAKAIDAIQERRHAKQQQQPQNELQDGGAERQAAAAGGAAAAAAAPAVAQSGGKASSGGRFERHFGQRRAKADPVLDERAPVLADDVLGLLGRKQKAKPLRQ